MNSFKQKYQVVASDMDITYHVTPNALLLYFQDCFARFLTSKRIAAFDIVKQNLIWVITEFDLHFTKERPLWADEISVEIWFSEISSVRMYANFRIYNQQQEICAEGTSCWVIINSITKRPFAALDMLTSAGIEANTSFEHTISKPKSNVMQVFKEIQHKVNVTDLDFNGHVCNRSYLTIAMGMAPLEFIKTTEPQRIHIKFVREAFFDEVLTCKASQATDTQNIFFHNITNSLGKEICSIYSEWKPINSELNRDVAELIKR